MGTITNKTPVVLLTGFGGQERAAELLEPGTVVIHHDLSGLREGLVIRSELTSRPGATPRERVAALQLVHGCVSCTLREDLLPLLRALHRRGDVRRIVVRLDPTLEAEALCEAIEHVVVDMVGAVSGPAGRDVEVVGVFGFVNGETWLDDVLGDHDLGERYAVPPDDERTVAQLAVGHVSSADVVVVGGDSPDPARLHAVLRRLAPTATITRGDDSLLTFVAGLARNRPEPDPFAPLLDGCPPLEPDGDVRIIEFTARKPLHPGRFHEAIDVLLDGIVQAKGRLWLATRPNDALWLESAGAGLRLGDAGPWLAAGGEGTEERWAMASAAWDEEFGDRATHLVALTAGADADRVLSTLRWAELDETELAAGEQLWSTWDDPFGEMHAEPCADLNPEDAPGLTSEFDQEEMK